jgi:glycine cleavage system regulatory protein
MQVPLVMTVIGKDRPGLVDLIASVVAEHGGNWLESRMCHLAGEFAGILRADVPEEKEAALGQALKMLDAKGLVAVVRRGQTSVPQRPSQMLAIELIGHDRPGIVRQVSQILASQGVNVEELNTECMSAPMSGEILFKANATIQLPANCDLVALRTELEKIAADLLVDIRLEPLQAV